MSLEYAFRPIDDAEEGLKADQKALEEAQRLAVRFSAKELIEKLSETPAIRSVYSVLYEEKILKTSSADLTSSFARIYESVTDLRTVFASEEFRSKRSFSYEEAYKAVEEMSALTRKKAYNPKIRLQRGLHKFIKAREKVTGTGALIAYTYRTARAAFRLGRIDLAINTLENALSRAKVPAAYRLSELLAFFYRFKNDEDEEIRALNTTLYLFPLRVRVRRRLLYLYEKRGLEAHKKRAEYILDNASLLQRAHRMSIEAGIEKKGEFLYIPETQASKKILGLALVLLSPESI